MKEFIKLLKLFFNGNEKLYARTMGIVLIALSQAGVYLAYLFILWNGRFYGALETKNFDAFIDESIYFVIIAVIIVFIAVLTKYLSQKYALKWRIWMTDYALTNWLKISNKNLEGSDQRIQEDIMRFTDLFESIFLEMISRIVTIIMFVPMLFTLGSKLVLFGYNITGIMFYVVLAYTVIGFYISRKIAKPLIGLEYDSQKYEAEFRYHLVHARDGKDYSINYFNNLIEPIVGNHISLYKKQRDFLLWQKLYDQFSFLIPFILLAPSFFAGVYTLGALMQIKSTFSRVRNAMAYILDNYNKITEFQAINKRLCEFFNLLERHSNVTAPCI